MPNARGTVAALAEATTATPGTQLIRDGGGPDDMYDETASHDVEGAADRLTHHPPPREVVRVLRLLIFLTTRVQPHKSPERLWWQVREPFLEGSGNTAISRDRDNTCAFDDAGNSLRVPSRRP